ncbi:MAG: BtrH N-terminal domain-containing protein [Bacteroidales bacterium]|nr:BtrH N-terminal domain-containing protein [Bacteroidales bacterium]
MKKELNFEHKQYAHCENGVVSNLLNFYGIQLSEPMIFGIGSGLFFSHMPFLKIDGIPVTSFRPLPGIIFSRISKRLGVKFEKRRFRSNPEAAMQALNKNIDKDIPTGMLVGVYNLSYFPVSYRFHFNAHNIVVYGKNDQSYMISDPIMENCTELTYNELKRVRYAKGVFAPKGHMYWVEKIPENIDLKKAILKGINHTCKDMLTIPVPMFGVKGIRFLAKHVRKYPQKMTPKKAALFAGQIVRAQEEIGTGGAGFRYIYAAFLQEASKILENESLVELSKEMTGIGNQWREFAVITGRIIKNRNKADENYELAAQKLFEIADKEEMFFEKLKNSVK